MPLPQLEITRLANALGAEVRGLDIAEVAKATAKDNDAVREIEKLLWEHQVLFFPDQHPSVETHVAFGERFGELQGHPHLKNADSDHGKIFELHASRGGVADEWHSDLTFMPKPSIYSILHMIRSPAVGGDTLWANLYRVFDELSPPMQELCEGLSALHNAEPHGRPEVMTVHPLVRVHPETGRKVLFANEHFTRRIVEMSQPESDNLLAYLTRFIAHPRFSVRYRWAEGTVAMWDNRCTQHSVLNDFDGERVIQRVTVMGDEVRGSGPRWAPYERPGGRSDTIRHDRLLKDYLRASEPGS
jgi:taurine dioxygenase